MNFGCRGEDFNVLAWHRKFSTAFVVGNGNGYFGIGFCYARDCVNNVVGACNGQGVGFARLVVFGFTDGDVFLANCEIVGDAHHMDFGRRGGDFCNVLARHREFCTAFVVGNGNDYFGVRACFARDCVNDVVGACNGQGVGFARLVVFGFTDGDVFLANRQIAGDAHCMNFRSRSCD